MDDDQIDKLLASLKLRRDKAILLLMLHGGLRPGEVLSLHLRRYPVMDEKRITFASHRSSQACENEISY